VLEEQALKNLEKRPGFPYLLGEVRPVIRVECGFSHLAANKEMTMNLTRIGIAAFLTVFCLALSAGAADKKAKRTDPVVFNVTAKEISEEFAKRAAAATKKYNPEPTKGAKGAPARIDIDGIVKEVNEKDSMVVLEGFKANLTVVLKAKKISGEKEGKRIAIAKGGSFTEFKDKKAVVIEFDEVKLERLKE
jgi:hypothetical protein